MFITEVDADKFPEALARFEDLFDTALWRRRVRNIEMQIRGNRFLAEYLRNENRLLYALDRLSERRRRSGLVTTNVMVRGEYEAMSFVSQVVNLHGSFPDPKDGRALVGRVRGSFQNLADLRALQFEFVIAAHLANRKFNVHFPSGEQGTYDFIATKDGDAVEVECKSIANKGQRVPMLDVLTFHGVFHTHVKSMLKGIRGGVYVRVIVPKRLPSGHADRLRLAECIRRAILAGGSAGELAKVTVDDFDPKDSPFRTFPLDRAAFDRFMRQRFGLDNKPIIIEGSKDAARALIVSIESQQEDKLLDTMMETAKDAADRQLSKTRAGIVCIKLEGLTADELAELGDESGHPSALRVAASQFLNRPACAHVTCLAFFSDGAVTRSPDGFVTQQGRSYFFAHPQSKFYGPTSASALQ